MEQFHTTNPKENKKDTYNIGQKVVIENKDSSNTEYEIVNILDSQKVVTQLDFDYVIKNPVVVLILDKQLRGALAGYHQDLNIILANNETSPEIMLHEIVHSIEMTKPISSELQSFYEKVLEILPDNSNLQPNFRKNIHEFVADAYSKKGFIETLKNKGLYDEFKELTKYIFE